jgi:hypothetical protein
LECPCGVRIYELFLSRFFNSFNNTSLVQEPNLKGKVLEKGKKENILEH